MDQPPTRSRAFSYRSDKSASSKTKEELVESPKDKERRDNFWKGASKANPNAAINEAQPGDRAILESTTIAPLRSIQHNDAQGNPITDPDLSNPTRPRLERPLDTIRSFEKQIDKGYKRRTSFRAESYDQNSQHGHSRRSSYFGGYDGASSPNRYSQVNGGGQHGDQRQYYMGPGPSGPPRMRYGNRQQSDSMLYGQQRPYQQHNHQQSQATMNTDITNGSDSTGPWANSTDPSSENSSIDKGHPAMKANVNGDHMNASNGYYPNGAHNSIPEDGAYPMRNGAGMSPAPNAQRQPIPLGNSNVASPARTLPTPVKPEPEKRKSWLKRRFSKNG